MVRATAIQDGHRGRSPSRLLGDRLTLTASTSPATGAGGTAPVVARRLHLLPMTPPQPETATGGRMTVLLVGEWGQPDTGYVTQPDVPTAASRSTRPVVADGWSVRRGCCPP